MRRAWRFEKEQEEAERQAEAQANIARHQAQIAGMR